MAVDAMHTVNKLCGTAVRTMQYQNFDGANQLLFNAKRIFVYAAGSFQRNVARELNRLFMKYNMCIYELPAEDIMDKMDQELQYLKPEDDVVIMISLRGESELVREMAERMHVQGIPMISLTHHTDNTLSQLSKVNLYADTISVQSHEVVFMFYILLEMWFISYCQFVEDSTENIAQ
mgnify:FL=1